MKEVAGALRLQLAQYRELAAFTQFGSDLDAATIQQLTRGARMVELLKQEQYVPLPMEEQVAVIYAGNIGMYDKLPVDAVRPAAAAFVAHLKEMHADILHTIATVGKLDTVRDTLKAAALKFIETYTPGS
jgi:F-type H+/Na+-transporting ATPase subunit alpha